MPEISDGSVVDSEEADDNSGRVSDRGNDDDNNDESDDGNL